MQNNYTKSLTTSQQNDSLSAAQNEARQLQTELLPVEIYLNENCEFRFNILYRKTEVRMRTQGEWRHLDKRAMNSLVVAARKALPDVKPQRYWFTTDETRAIQRTNIRFQHTLDIETMVEACFRQPVEGEFVNPLNAHQMLAIIASAYPAVQDNEATRVRLGLALQRQGFVRHDGRQQRSYYAIPLLSA